MPTAPVTDWSTAVMTSFTAVLSMFLAAIPKVIGFLVILIIGWIIASALASLVAAILRRARFDDLAVRSGFAGFVRSMGLQTDASGVVADVVKWFVRLIVLVVAFDELGLPAVSNVLNQLVLWLPNLVVALIVLMVAGLVANAVYRIVRGAMVEAGFENSDLLAGIARAAIWVFAVIVAVNQIGIATTLANTLFIGFVAALALALGLAFGLGGRETAALIVHDWYMKGREAAPKMQEAKPAAQAQANTETPHPYAPEEPRRVA